MKRYTTYIFDFDYTLVDSSRGIVTCFRHVLGNHGHTGVTDTEIKRTIGKTLEESFSILTGITEAGTLADYKREYVKAADVHMTANTFFFPETIEVLEALKSQGAVLGIVSTKFRYRILDLFEKTGHDGLVDFIVGGEDVKAAKPAPEGLLLAIGRASGGQQDHVGRRGKGRSRQRGELGRQRRHTGHAAKDKVVGEFEKVHIFFCN